MGFWIRKREREEISSWHKKDEKENRKMRLKDANKIETVKLEINFEVKKGDKLIWKVEEIIYRRFFEALGGHTSVMVRFLGVSRRTIYAKNEMYQLGKK